MKNQKYIVTKNIAIKKEDISFLEHIENIVGLPSFHIVTSSGADFILHYDGNQGGNAWNQINSWHKKLLEEQNAQISK
jgi:hypothetical protein